MEGEGRCGCKDAWQQGSRSQDRQVDNSKTALDGEFCLNRLTTHLRDVDKVVMLGLFFLFFNVVLHPAVTRLLDVGQVTVNDLVFGDVSFLQKQLRKALGIDDDATV